MRSAFKILFSIEVLNNFFSTGRWNDIKIIPLPETEKLLKQNEYITRQIGNELLVIAKTDSSGKVFNNPQLYTRFSFMIIPETANYLNYTNFSFSKLLTPVFHFHNLNGNTVGTRHFISKKINDYSNTITYLPGSFSKAADGKIYESIKINNSGAGSIAPDDSQAEPALPPEQEDKLYSKNFWVLHGDTQFAGGADTKETFQGVEYALEPGDGICNFKTSVKKTEHLVHVYAFNTQSLEYTKEVLADKVKSNDLFDEVQVDMRAMPSGKYRVQVGEDIKFIYLYAQNNYNGMAMFVDVFHLPDADPQSFVDAAQKPKRTRYTIAFSARRVLWQYKTRTNIINKIEDTSGDFNFKSNGLRKFISKRPIPFSDVARKTFVAKSGALNITSPLPNPQADKLLDKQNELYTTESFINF